MCLMRRRPLYSLIVADPADQLGTGTLDHPLRPLTRYVFVRALRLLARRSNAAMYVTRDYLQQRYPLKWGAGFATSDVYIPPDAYSSKPRSRDTFVHSPKTLIYVAMMAQGYKGHDDMIETLAQARRVVPDLRLVLVGDGPLRPKIEALADRAGVRESVYFAGKLGHGQAMMSQLDAADLFVMPSRAEGLPRALVEAMARGLPALSTDVGGIPELLPPDCLVPANEPASFARRLVEVINDPDRLSAMSDANLQRSRDYSVDKVTCRMINFYRHIREEASHES
jgi:glycosyltransferase involved in cell wall biosynthesis